MSITLFSFLSAQLWCSIYILIIYFLRTKNRLHQHFGLRSVLLLYVIVILRMFFSFEIPHNIVINDKVIYPHVYLLLNKQISNNIFCDVKLVNILIVIWISVSLFLSIRFIVRYNIINKTITKYACPINNDEVRNFHNIKALTGQNVDISIYTLKNIEIPIGIGIFKRKILLPESGYNSSDLKYILLHEYTHFLHNDILIKVLISLFCNIFWFNPVVYLLKHDLEQTLEIKCDLAVVSYLSSSQRVSYVKTIIKVFESCRTINNRPYTSNGLIRPKDYRYIKERFHIVTNHTQVQRNLLLDIFTVFILLLSSYLFLIQPQFDSPKHEEECIDYDYSNSYILHDGSDNYWLYINDNRTIEISKESALMHKKIGFTIIQNT